MNPLRRVLLMFPVRERTAAVPSFKMEHYPLRFHQTDQTGVIPDAVNDHVGDENLDKL
jgi:hypothetical protein